MMRRWTGMLAALGIAFGAFPADALRLDFDEFAHGDTVKEVVVDEFSQGVFYRAR